MAFPLNAHPYDENDRYVIEAFSTGAFTAEATANDYEAALLIANEAVNPNGLNCIAAHIWDNSLAFPNQLIHTVRQIKRK